MLKFKVNAVYNSYVQPACLPQTLNYQPATNANAHIVGYGITSENGVMPTYLQNAAVTYYVSCAECVNYGSDFKPSTQICAG